MKPRKILFPTDFSRASDAALESAAALAKHFDACLLIVHVEELSPLYAGEYYYGVPNPNNAQLMEMLDQVAPTTSDVNYEHRLISGDPASAIVRLANDEEAELIVMGTHGRRGLSRVLMGSVAETVVRRAHCPVLTFKLGAQQLSTPVS